MTERTFDFYKQEGNWFLHLPEWAGDPADLQMVEGAEQWLDLLSINGKNVTVLISDQYFEQAEILTLLRVKEENLGGGGIYFLETFQGKKIELKLWLCEVTRFVFKELPQKVYFLVLE